MATYTVNEAAALLGLKPRSVRKFIERGMIKAEMRAGVWFITEDEVNRYNRERRSPGGPKGRKMSEESKRKLSEARKGDKNPFKGKQHTPETLAKISVASAQQPRGEASHAWKGGRTIDTTGYTWVFALDHPYVVNRYVLEHRLVMEQVLGRFLLPDEVVHHINGDITDNRPENLEVMAQSEHARFHRLNPHIRRRKSA